MAPPHNRRRGPPPSSGEGRDIAISKALSYVLRHAAQREGVKLDEGGYANVQDLVGCCIFYWLLNGYAFLLMLLLFPFDFL